MGGGSFFSPPVETRGERPRGTDRLFRNFAAECRLSGAKRLPMLSSCEWEDEESNARKLAYIYLPEEKKAARRRHGEY